MKATSAPFSGLHEGVNTINTINTEEDAVRLLVWSVAHTQETKNRIRNGSRIVFDGIDFESESPAFSALKGITAVLSPRERNWLTILPSCHFNVISDFSGMRLSYLCMRNVRLRRALLIGANLDSTDLSGADIAGARMHGVQLNGADLTEAQFENARMSHVSLFCATLRGASFQDATMIFPTMQVRGVDFTGVRSLTEDQKKKLSSQGAIV